MTNDGRRAPAGRLVFDVGNSAAKWGWLPGGWLPGGWLPGDRLPTASTAIRFAATGRIGIRVDDFEQQLAAAIDAALAATSRTSGAVVAADIVAIGCCVGPAARRSAVARVVARFAATAPADAAVRWFSAAERYALDGSVLVNGYRVPTQLGADRWHALIAGFAHLGAQRPGLVVNAGTATTVDAIDAGGRFLGGVIAPGIDLMLASLAGGTADLPAVAPATPAVSPAIGAAHPDHTDAAIRGGVLDAQIGLIERRWRRLAAASTRSPAIVLAGGNARILAPLLGADRLHDLSLEAPSAASMIGVAAAAGTGAEDPRELIIDDNLVLRGVVLRALAEAAAQD